MYICPAGEALLFVSYKRETDGLSLRRYATRACISCELRKRCTTSSHRSIARWEHEHVLEDVQGRTRGLGQVLLPWWQDREAWRVRENDRAFAGVGAGG
jgi:hypothetical protein